MGSTTRPALPVQVAHHLQDLHDPRPDPHERNRDLGAALRDGLNPEAVHEGQPRQVKRELTWKACEGLSEGLSRGMIQLAPQLQPIYAKGNYPKLIVRHGPTVRPPGPFVNPGFPCGLPWPSLGKPPFMAWNVNREGEVIYVDLGSVDAAEWEAVLDAINAEMVSDGFDLVPTGIPHCKSRSSPLVRPLQHRG
jgi:hypothetical protein